MAKVMVIGSGGREHALAWSLSHCADVSEVFAAPGSEGMADVATLVEANDTDSQVRLAKEREVDLVVVGPEVPLVEGIADRLRSENIAVFGPGADAARIEGDKQWAKDLMVEAGVATAQAAAFKDLDLALGHLGELDGPCVIKATGLAAGKGVTVCDDREQAERAVRACLVDAAFGEAGASVLVEERLHGPELSVFAVVDGERVATFAPSRDHKRLHEGDRGPNTGGMGAYSPVADASAELLSFVRKDVVEPTLQALGRRGFDYRGLLYVGLMLTTEGPKVLEYNCRFGDPETQVVLPAFDGDLFALLHGAACGRLPVEGPLSSAGAAVGVVLASEGYPATSTRGVEIEGLDQLEPGDLVFHAGTKRVAGRWQTDGGRVLCAVGTDRGLDSARAKAHTLAERLSFPGAQRRNDIAFQE